VTLQLNKINYSQLLDFVQEYMPRRMQDIYLPLLIGELVDARFSHKVVITDGGPDSVKIPNFKWLNFVGNQKSLNENLRV